MKKNCLKVQWSEMHFPITKCNSDHGALMFSGHAAKIQKLDRTGDHIGAADLFLKCLKESYDEPGRYAAFRDALSEAGMSATAYHAQFDTAT